MRIYKYPTWAQSFHLYAVLIAFGLIKLAAPLCSYGIDSAFLHATEPSYNSVAQAFKTLVWSLPPERCTKMETTQERDTAFIAAWDSRTGTGNGQRDVSGILGPVVHVGPHVIEITGSAGSELDMGFNAGYIFLTAGGYQHATTMHANMDAHWNWHDCMHH